MRNRKTTRDNQKVETEQRKKGWITHAIHPLHLGKTHYNKEETHSNIVTRQINI